MDIVKPGRLSMGSLSLDMDSLAYGRREKSLFTPLLDESDDMSLFSPNVFGMNSGTKDLMNSYSGAIDNAEKDNSKVSSIMGTFQESLLASPNPGVQYEHELLYDQEPTPIKRDLFGSPSPDELSDSGESCSSDSSMHSNYNTFSLHNFQTDSNRIKCPSCKEVLNVHANSKQNTTIFNVREVHRHFNVCLGRNKSKEEAKAASAKEDKKIDNEIASNIARVRKAIGKFELQDRIKIMQSLYRLGKAASSKSYGPPSTSSMSTIYADTPSGTPMNETVDASDQQVLSLLYSNSKGDGDLEEVSTMNQPAAFPRNSRKRKTSPTVASASFEQQKFRPRPMGTPTLEMMQSVFAVNHRKASSHSWDFVDEEEEELEELSMKRLRR